MSGLEATFRYYVEFGGTTSVSAGMTSAKFSKVLKDAAILDRRLDRNAADLIFTKHCPKGNPRLNFDGFVGALEGCASKKGVPPAVVFDAVAALAVTGPSTAGTTGVVSSQTRLHDDKSLYTGVYGKGGPTKVDSHNVALDGLRRSDQLAA